MDNQKTGLSWDEIGRTSLWWDMPEPVSGTVGYQDYGHINGLTEKINQELMPMLEQFLYQQVSPQVIYQIRQTVDAYFATQWFANYGVDIAVDVDPYTAGVKVTAIINYGKDDPIGEVDEINYGVDHLLDEQEYEIHFSFDGMDEALEAFPETDDLVKEKKEPVNADDILFEPVDLEAERKPKQPEPVYGDYC